MEAVNNSPLFFVCLTANNRNEEMPLGMNHGMESEQSRNSAGMLLHLSKFRAPLSSSLRKNDHKASPSVWVGWCVPADPGACLINAVESRWDSYLKQLRACKKEFSVDSVHHLRVATRRLITQYFLIGCVASGEKTPKMCKKLKSRLKILGEVRDAQIQRVFIDQQLARFPFLAPFHEVLRRRENRLVKDVASDVDGFKNHKLNHWTRELCKQIHNWPQNAEKRDELTAEVLGALADAFTSVVRCRQSIDPANSQTIHRTRVAFKKFRYMVEALSPDFTGLGKGQLRRFGDYQSRMGNLQDLEILEESVGHFLRENPDSQAKFAPFIRYLHQRRGKALRACLDHADALFRFWDPVELARTAA